MPTNHRYTVPYQRMAPTEAVLRGPNQWPAHNTAECAVLYHDNTSIIVAGQEWTVV